eukprot:2406957-Alexandrium_andersonii.AAC.1
MVSTIPDKVERTVRLFESLILGVSSMGERQAIGIQDSIPTRLFRIAGLFQEFGCSSLVVKQCLSWIDTWRTGNTPNERALLETSPLERGGHYPFVVVSDRTLAFRPSEISSKGSTSKAPSKKLADVCNFFSSAWNVETHLGEGQSTSAWKENAPGYGNYRESKWDFWESTECGATAQVLTVEIRKFLDEDYPK